MQSGWWYLIVSGVFMACFLLSVLSLHRIRVQEHGKFERRSVLISILLLLMVAFFLSGLITTMP